MARVKFHTLSEQMFYVLLCLEEERCGIDILDQVPAMTEGRVRVGSGTLYNLLEQFLEAGFIVETRVEGRRRSYVITAQGSRCWIRSTNGSVPRPGTTGGSWGRRDIHENTEANLETHCFF